MNNAMESAGGKSAVMLTGGKGDVGDKNPKKRRKAIATYKYWIDVAYALKCKAHRHVCGECVSQYHIKKNLIMP